jgi:hypothetical protein
MKRRPFLRLAGLSALFGVSGTGCNGRVDPLSPVELLPSDEPIPSDELVSALDPLPSGAWSFVLLPDTQCYSESFPDVFRSQTEWIARERRARSIQFVLHLGDVTNNNVHPEWAVAQKAMNVLRDAGVPFLMSNGNHDLGPGGGGTSRTSLFSDYFPQRNCRVPGESENAFMNLTVGEAKFLILSLEFGPRDAAVSWANKVVAQHPDHHAILLTHAYLYSDDSRYDWSTKRSGQQLWNPNAYGIGAYPDQAKNGVNDGEQLWRKLVARHKQFVFTFNGHVLNGGVGHLASKGAAGNTVHQMLVNYQCGVVPDRRNGGGGFLRLVEVQPDGITIKISDYSPFYDQWLTDGDRDFTLALDRDLNKKFNASLIPQS